MTLPFLERHACPLHIKGRIIRLRDQLLDVVTLIPDGVIVIRARILARHAVDNVSFDLGAMLARKDKVVNALTGGVAYLFKKNKVTRYEGHGRIAGPGSVEVLGARAFANCTNLKEAILEEEEELSLPLNWEMRNFFSLSEPRGHFSMIRWPKVIPFWED